jgi:alkanesulfonate monooxygenase SsuD/methylene tetrahydromethanopterin reductase-like flavin-dependent oxidoreductase (luciferase family)
MTSSTRDASRPGRARPLVGVAIDGPGSHPATFDDHAAAAAQLEPGSLVAAAQLAERVHFDFVALDDGFDPTDRPGIGGDAVLSLARVAPVTGRIGLLATTSVTHTEPFHLSKNLATLDLVSDGRAGWRVSVSTSDAAARRFGRTTPLPLPDLWDEADDAIEVVTRLWDSWEDDAVIRDVATGRYLDRSKVHYIDFEGPFFSVRGPSITPRSPQGQPPIVIAADNPHAAEVAARRADIILVTVADPAEALALRSRLRDDVAAADRDPDDVAVVVNVRIGTSDERRVLDQRRSHQPSALDLVGDAGAVADALAQWFAEGRADGFLLLPDTVPDTLAWLADDVAPLLLERGLLDPTPGHTFRDRLGLQRPINRYATTEAGSWATA